MTIQNKEPRYTKSQVDPNELKDFLVFPSGLTLEQAKQNAKTLKKTQGITQSEAMVYICWGNGITDIRDYSQAVPSLIKSTFDLSIDEFGLIEAEDVIHGYWWIEEEKLEFMTTRARSKSNGSVVIRLLAERLIAKKKHKKKARNFLKAAKECISFLNHDFYSIRNNKPIEQVTDINEISIDLHTLLFGNKFSSNSKAIMSALLASFYNKNETARLLMAHSLYVTHENGKKSTYDISDKSERLELADTNHSYALLGGSFLTLDKSNKNIVKRLLDNYHGW